MLKKALIIGMIAINLLIAAASVSASDQTLIFNDKKDDVMDADNNYLEGIDDYDMKTITYTKEDKQVTIEIEVHGTTDPDALSIVIYFITDQGEYFIFTEAGESAGVNIEFAPIPVTAEGFGTSIITYSFEVEDDDEELDTILVQFAKPDDDPINPAIYEDIFPNLDDFLDVNIIAPLEGKVNERISFSSTVEGGVEPLKYEWDFDGDGEVDSTKADPSYRFKGPGNYTISLAVTDSSFVLGGNITEIRITGSSSSSDDDDESDDSSSLMIFIALLAVIVIAGIAVVIFIMKR